MSFNDLEQGFGVSTSQRNRPQQQGNTISYVENNPLTFVFIDGGESDYKHLAQRVAQQVFHINGNITSIERLVGFLGTARDTTDIRNKL